MSKKELEKLSKLKIGKQMKLFDGKILVLRVPGGYVYYYQAYGESYYVAGCVFISFSDMKKDLDKEIKSY